MKTFEDIADIKNYKAMINVGGGVASLGTSFNSKLCPQVSFEDLIYKIFPCRMRY